jgi:hypothetical protein
MAQHWSRSSGISAIEFRIGWWEKLRDIIKNYRLGMSKSQGGTMQMHAAKFDDPQQRWELILAVGSVWAALLLTGLGIILLAAKFGG